MKYFKDSNNTIFAYAADGSQDNLIGNKTPITLEEVEQLKEQHKTDAFNSLSYAEKRASEYPLFTEYLDGIVKGDQAQIDKYIADCLAVKAKYPKQ